MFLHTYLLWFLKIYISQGSVATTLMVYLETTLLYIFSTECDGENVGKSVNNWRRYGQKFAAYFLGHPVYNVYKFAMFLCSFNRCRNIS